MRLFFTLLAVLISVSSLAQTKIQGITLNANEVFRDLSAKKLELSGDVTIIYNGQTILADKATIFLESQQIEASGNVIMTTDSVYTQGDTLSYNYNTELGTFTNAFIKSGQVVFEGDIVDKIGPNEYLAKNATYTACDTCPPSWSFSGAEIKAELGGYAHIKLPILKVGDVPIFFLPKIIVPLKSERQSGLLVPSWTTSKDGGFEIGQSFFWAIDRSSDATFQARYYEKRGVKGMAEYRYVLTENSRGKLNTAFLEDRQFGNNVLAEPVKTKRWFLNYDHYYELPNNYFSRIQLQMMSDLLYTKDFNQEIDVIGHPSLENKISLTKNWKSVHTSVEAAYNINLLKVESEPKADNLDAVHRFPEVKAAWTQRRILDTPLFFQVDSTFTHFARKNYSFDNVDVSDGSVNSTTGAGGTFDPFTDILRTGTRVEVEPRITYPIKLANRFDILPALSVNHTAYTFNTDDPGAGTDAQGKFYSKSSTRQFVQTDLDVKTELHKVYDMGLNKRLKRRTLFQHTMVPSVKYSRIPFKNVDDHVFFGDFENKRFDQISDPLIELDYYDEDNTTFGDGRVQFDYNDRFFELEVVRLGLFNKLVRKQTYGDNVKYKTIAKLDIYQHYDFHHEKKIGRNAQPFTPLVTTLNLYFDGFETFTSTKYYHAAKVSDVSSRVKFFNPLGHFFEVTYNRRYKFDVDFEDDDNDGNTGFIPEFDQTTETAGFGLGYNSKYVDLIGRISYVVNEGNAKDRIDPLDWSYVATLKPPGNCWAISFKQYQAAGQDDIVTDYNVSFSFGGNYL